MPVAFVLTFMNNVTMRLATSDADISLNEVKSAMQVSTRLRLNTEINMRNM